MSRLLLILITTLCLLSTSALASADNTQATGMQSAQEQQQSSEGVSTQEQLQPYEEVGKPIENDSDSLTFNSQQMGMSGPLSLTGTYSDTFGYIVNAAYTKMINEWNAFSVMADWGEKENRLDLTWANQFAAHQRAKISVERLEQKMDFNYDSGETSEWVPQYSTGLGYQYLFDKGLLNDVELSGYYARAQSSSLDTIRYEQDGLQYDNYRHIAGATSEGLASTFDIKPWKTALLGLGLNYDKVFYHNEYQDIDAEDRAGFGFTMTLQQLISKHVKLELLSSQRETYDDYQAMLSWLMHSTSTSDIELNLTGERIIGQDNAPNDTQISLALAYYMDSHLYADGYNLSGQANAADLSAWSQKSLAYMDLVLAAADQKSVLVPNQSLDSDDNLVTNTQDQVTLKAGVTNTVELAPYLPKLNITDLSQHKVRLFGGPSDFTFDYDEDNQSITTTGPVPLSAAGKSLEPLKLVFMADTDDSTSFSDKLQNGDITELVLNFVVAAAGTQPFPNADFTQDRGVVVGTPYSQTYFLECKVEDQQNNSCPATSDTLFVNPNESSILLYTDAEHGGFIHISPEGSGLTVQSEDNAAQTFAVTGTPASNFPDPVTVTVKACNVSDCATAQQTINYSSDTPVINGGPIDPVTGGSAYPTYTFSNTEVSPGGSTSFDPTASFATISYQGAEVTDTNLVTTYTANSVSVATAANTVIPAKYATNPATNIDVVLHPTNTDGQSADNASNPFTIQVNSVAPVAPTVGAVTFSNATEGTLYDSGELVGNGIDIGTGTITSASVTFTDGTGAVTPGIVTEIFNGGLGLKLTGTPTMSGALEATITVTNSAGLTTTATTPSSLTINAANVAPTVGAVTFSNATEGTLYDSGELVGNGIEIGTGTITSASVTFTDGTNAVTPGIVTEIFNGGLGLKLTGTPTMSGALEATITVTNSAGLATTAATPSSLTINAAVVTQATLTCPDPTAANLNSDPSTVVVQDSLAVNQTFNRASNVSPLDLVFVKASVNSGQDTLTCEYQDFFAAPGSVGYSTVATLPADLAASGAGWSGNSCTLNAGSGSVASCPVTYTE
jgi:hypothetical protein